MATTNWEDHPTAYRAHIIITATDAVTGGPLREDKYVGPYGRKGSAKGAATREIQNAKRYGKDEWYINKNWIQVDNWEVTGKAEQLVGFGVWSEVLN